MSSKNQEDTIYDVLRTDILDLRLRPGMVISIKDISEVYGTGRSPVRDALIRLSKEGLITFLPQKGTMISKIDFERAQNERFLRICVEEKVMMEFMASCNLEATTELEMSLDRQRAIAKTGDSRAFLNEDVFFHSIFYKGASRWYCNQVVNANSGDYRRIRLLSVADTGIEDRVIRQHRELVDSIQAQDAERMHQIFNHHLNRLTIQERFLMDKHPDLFGAREEETRRTNDGLSVDFLVETKLRYNN